MKKFIVKKLRKLFNRHPSCLKRSVLNFITQCKALTPSMKALILMTLCDLCRLWPPCRWLDRVVRTVGWWYNTHSKIVTRSTRIFAHLQNSRCTLTGEREKRGNVLLNKLNSSCAAVRGPPRAGVRPPIAAARHAASPPHAVARPASRR